MQGLLAAPGGGKRAGTSVSAYQVSPRARLAVLLVVLDGARLLVRRASSRPPRQRTPPSRRRGRDIEAHVRARIGHRRGRA